jgi:quercetin dioxygenase-like cupin family protein
MPEWKIKRLHELNKGRFNGLMRICCLKPKEMSGIEADYVVLEPGHPIPPHAHRRARCFTFVVEGPVEVTLDGEVRRLIMNDFVLVPAGVAHGFRALETPATLFTIHSPAVR